METISLILISLHVLIMIILTYNLHPHLSLVANANSSAKQISSIIGYLSHLFCIALYHLSCIFTVWHSRRHGAGMIIATGILLIGEFIKILADIVEHAVETHHMAALELFFDVIYVWLFLSAIAITFRLAEKISRHEKTLVQLELLTNTVSEDSVND